MGVAGFLWTWCWRIVWALLVPVNIVGTRQDIFDTKALWTLSWQEVLFVGLAFTSVLVVGQLALHNWALQHPRLRIHVYRDIWAAALRLGVQVKEGTALLAVSIEPLDKYNAVGAFPSFPGKWDGTDSQHQSVIPGHYFLSLGKHHLNSVDGLRIHTVILFRSGSQQSKGAELGAREDKEKPNEVEVRLHFTSDGPKIDQPDWVCKFVITTPGGFWQFTQDPTPLRSNQGLVSKLFRRKELKQGVSE